MTPKGNHTESLAQLRQEIENVDRSLVLLLAARLDAAQRTLRFRSSHERRTTDGTQERRVLLRARGWARELGVPEQLVDTLFRTLIEEGKTRFQAGHAPAEPLPFVTVLLTAPERPSPALRGDSDLQLVTVTATR